MKTKGNGSHEANDRDTATDANLEPSSGDAPVTAKDFAGFPTPCRISFTHVRKRLADADGLYGKAIIDGLVHCEVLPDDSPREVAEVTHCQVKGDRESTIVELTTLTN